MYVPAYPSESEKRMFNSDVFFFQKKYQKDEFAFFKIKIT